LGISSIPLNDASAAENGVVIDYQAFGTTGSHLLTKYNKNRTLTHEVGHWLGLYHPWGDDGGTCNGSDSIADTPNQSDAVYACPSYPKYDNCTSASTGIMFMNFMQYTDDGCMNLFSSDQNSRMHAVLNVYRTTNINSPACNPVGIDELFSDHFQVYPNPAHGTLYLNTNYFRVEDLTIHLIDLSGRECFSMNAQSGRRIEIPLDNISTGLYDLVIQSK